MAIEIEAKFRLRDVAAMRQRLAALGSQPVRRVLEQNVYYDTAAQSLRGADCGLRIRSTQTADGQREAILTYKGARRKGELKIRQEEESFVEPAGAAAILQSLGFQPCLSFHKRRESYLLAGAKVEIDELPALGFFLEIEGPDEATIRNVRALLELNGEPMVQEPYTALIARHLGESATAQLYLHFAEG